MSEIVFHNVSHQYDDSAVLHNISATLTEHRIGIAGLNGSGKSTLIRMINGLIHPTSGTVHVNGLNVAKKASQVRKQVGFVFADPTSQIIMPSVIEDVEFSLRKTVKDSAQRRQQALKYLADYGLSPFADQSPYTLSGGQQQLLAITSIMATNPSIIVADEPTGALDLRNALRIRQLFQELPAQMIVVSHDFELLADMERILVLHDGHLVYDGEPSTALPFYRKLATA